MRPLTVVLAFAALVSPTLAEEGYRHGRIRDLDPGVTLQRATEATAEDALPNLPFLPGDRVWTDRSGRVEFQFPDGSVVRLDTESKLDYAGHDENQDERIVLRLWSGSLFLRLRTSDFALFEIETPGGVAVAAERGVYRVDVTGGEVWLSVFEGEATLEGADRRVGVEAGEQASARWGDRPEPAVPFDRGAGDEFARWDADREARETWTATRSPYLPEELAPYAGELEANGQWYADASVGYVWRPSVAVGWSPYWNGNWAWTPYGWTWVPYESWGWAPFHYGSWGFSVSLGWYWSPGRVWGPGWVSWAHGGRYVGWCPADRHGRPVWGPGHNRGHAVPRGQAVRGGRAFPEAWTFVDRADLGNRDVARRRVRLGASEIAGLRVAESAAHRPTRDVGALRDVGARPRASTRQVPGDFVRELAVDNKTTIPSPWLRRGRTPSREEAAPRYDQAQRSSGIAARPRTERDAATAPATRSAEADEARTQRRARSTALGSSSSFGRLFPREDRTEGSARSEQTSRRRSGTATSAETGERAGAARVFGRPFPREDRTEAQAPAARPRTLSGGERQPAAPPRAEPEVRRSEPRDTGSRPRSLGGERSSRPRSEGSSGSSAPPRVERSTPRNEAAPRPHGGASTPRAERSTRPSGGGAMGRRPRPDR